MTIFTGWNKKIEDTTWTTEDQFKADMLFMDSTNIDQVKTYYEIHREAILPYLPDEIIKQLGLEK